MTGYEKSPDYVGPEPTKREVAVVIVFFILVSAGIIWLKW